MRNILEIAQFRAEVALLSAGAAKATIRIQPESIRLPRISGIVAILPNRAPLPGGEISLVQEGRSSDALVSSAEDVFLQFGFIPNGGSETSAQLERLVTTVGAAFLRPRGGARGRVLVGEVSWQFSARGQFRSTTVDGAHRIQG